MALIHKDGVKFDVIAEGGARILTALARYAAKVSFPIVISCGSEGHPPDDPHSTGNAFDVSLKTLPNSQAILAARASLVQDLGSMFTVLFECPEKPDDPLLQSIAYINPEATAPHFHIQVRKGAAYPIESLRV